MEKVNVEKAGTLSAREIIKYPWRVDLFLDKCRNRGTVTIRDTGENVQIVPGPATAETIRALEDFRKTNNPFKGRYFVNILTENASPLSIPISSLAKTKEFGGGGGVAGGTELTKVVEAGQCIVCAQLQNSNGFESSVSLGKGETIESILAEKEQLDETWKASLDAIGDALVDKFPPGIWHWQDSFVKSIQTIYLSLDDKLVGTFDRYNPADIWYTDKDYKFVSEAVETDGIVKLEDLTDRLNEAYKESKIIGISLKKTMSPRLEEYTSQKRDVKFNLENIQIGDRKIGTVYVNITFLLNGTEHLCQIRRDGSSFRATVKALHEKRHYDGSVGKGIILKCLGKIADEADVTYCDPKFWENKRMSMVEAIAMGLDNLVLALRNAGEAKQREFLGRLVRYAWSIHTESCDFLKVH